MHVALLSVTREGHHPMTLQCIEATRQQFGFELFHTWGSSDLPLARSKLLHQVLRDSAADYFFFIDSDMVFQPNDVFAVTAALGNGVGEVCGVYMKRNALEVTFEAFSAIDERLGDGGRVIDIASAPLGFTALDRNALRAAAAIAQRATVGGETLPLFCLPHVHNGVYYSEDYALSHLLRCAGFRVAAHMGVPVRHISEHPFDYRDAVTGRGGASLPPAPGYRLQVAQSSDDYAARLMCDTSYSPG